jgi:hypothetical protein
MGMIIRIVTKHVAPDQVEDWKAYGRDIALPSVLSQPGCKQILRLRRRGQTAFQLMTFWDSEADMARFQASQIRLDLLAGATPFDLPGAPHEPEIIYDVVPDPVK